MSSAGESSSDQARAAAPEPSAEPPPLARRLGALDILAIGVNATVGSGVFALPDDLARAMGGWSPLGFLLCTLLLLPIARAFSELAKRHEDQGAAFLYCHRAFGPQVGYVIGVLCWANSFVSWAASSTLLASVLGFEGVWRQVAAAAVTLALGAVNYVGVRPGAFVVRAVVIGKVAAILCYLLVAVAAFDPARLGGELPLGLRGVGDGIFIALYPLQGFEVAPVAAGETKQAKSSVPFGTMGALLFSSALFVLVQLTMVGAYPGIAQKTDEPLVAAARHVSPTLGLVVLVGSVVSIAGFSAGSALGTPRFAQAIARAGLLPASLARTHPRFESPYVAITISTLLTMVLASGLDYRRLVGISNLTVVLQYLGSCVALGVERRREARAASAPLAPTALVIPALGSLASLGLLYLGAKLEDALVAVGCVAVGLLVRAGLGVLERRRALSSGGRAS